MSDSELVKALRDIETALTYAKVKGLPPKIWDNADVAVEVIRAYESNHTPRNYADLRIKGLTHSEALERESKQPAGEVDEERLLMKLRDAAFDCYRIEDKCGEEGLDYETASRAFLEIIRPYLRPQPSQPFQERVRPWMVKTFGLEISSDCVERNHRFIEEALELVQACGATKTECLQLVEYVYGRTVGEKGQEVGGVMVTLAALCLAQKIDMDTEAERELDRIWGKIEQIRAKQASKPHGSALPQPSQPVNAEVVELLKDMRMQASYSDKVTMPVPLYERIKIALAAMQQPKPQVEVTE